MRNTLAALSLAAGLGLIGCDSAAAFPADAGTIQQAATATSGVERTQYAEHRGWHHITKCYREFVIGDYVCHRYHNL
jgi:hypothetical protein